ncbi:alpha-ribazole phosphatase [Fictibacillus macauensis ZFHKF-1]|uniref:Alpha-ribazole phosphatase n=1 Tax=Fictibacillus macauensis ZFHKF-1 TaxID=1196324 RepID=I8AMX2_9BACL|nr:histidine phosphatase family protein [Fictibacillus macauensis]EIT87054.1 alpha-ribazole phosphatase [Fictibacillus macauensis ZFHKF-1]
MAMDDQLAITLLRHGLTKENQEKRYIGWSDPPLCEEGRQLLHPLTDTPDVIYSSPSLRAMETAAMLFPNSDVTVCEGFRELHFGEWELKTYADLCNNPHYRQWIDHPTTITPPGGESYATFTARVLHAWFTMLEQMQHDDRQQAVIVTHGGPLRLLLSHFAPQEKDMWHWSVSHGQGFTLQWQQEERRGVGRCTSLQEAPFTAKDALYNNTFK